MKTTLLLVICLPSVLLAAPFGEQISESGIRHSFLLTGNKTAIVEEDGMISWEVAGRSRDGEVLPNGNVLVAFAKNVREFTRDKEVVWKFKAPKFKGAHEIHVLTTNGKAVTSRR